MNALTSRAKQGFLVTFTVLALLLFLEGLSHTYTVVRHWLQIPPNYIQYDAELGWVNLPNTHIPQMYGAGVPLTINSQGFRATQEYTKETPAGKFRVICSGDSFTSGDGVGDAENWCERLKAKHVRLEAINLGQSAYDIGQIYLRYKREGTAFQHDAHVLAFTGYDLDKMVLDRLNGRAKPLLKLTDGKLQVLNSPVPKANVSRRTVQLLESRSRLAELSLLDLSTRLTKRFIPTKVEAPVETVSVPREEIIQTAVTAFKDLDSLAKKNGQRLLITYLPTYYDYYMGQYGEDRVKLQKACAENHLTYLDLTEPLRTIPVRDVVEGGSGHYRPVVHDIVAGKIATAITPWIEAKR